MTEPTSLSGGTLWGKICRWSAAHPYYALTLAVFAALGPFLAKPFNIDDPLFIWVAHQIQAHPGNPYGFEVNWYGMAGPMWIATENPPLSSYYLALAAAVLGWSELALHAAFLLPALAVVLGTCRLARRFCEWPALAALATLVSPVFLVSGTTVMCDVMMLAFWVWAVVFWVEGLERENYRQLSLAGGLVALAVLTKFFGVCLLPLLAAHGFLEKRRPGRWLLCLLIPVVVICAYQWATRELYGRAGLSDAMDYASHAHKVFGVSRMVTGLIALSFTGGCLAVAVIFMPLLWRTRALLLFAASALFIAAAVFHENGMLRPVNPLAGAPRVFEELQTAFWAVGGLSVLALAVADFWKRRDARSALLGLWLFGTFLFAAFFNWTVNGRSILPMAPALGILLARRLGETVLAGREFWTRGVVAGLAASGALAYFVAQSDFLLAIAVRQSARETFAKHGGNRSAFWYEGHWGFQYYLDRMNAAAVDLKHPAFKAGDLLAIPGHNTSYSQPPPEIAEPCDVIYAQGPRWLTTWSEDTGAGFYSSVVGPLPFAFGQVVPEWVLIYRCKTNAPPER